MHTYNELRKNLKKDFSNLKEVKLALLGDSATQMYAQAIKGYGYEVGIHFNTYEADYDQIERQIYDPDSELYQFKPDIVVIFRCIHKLQKRFSKLGTNEKPEFARQVISEVEDQYNCLLSRLTCKVIVTNYPELNDAVFGNYANKTSVSMLYQLRSVNLELMRLAQCSKNLHILDINVLQAHYGYHYVTNDIIYVNSDLFLSIDFLPILAKQTTDIIQSVQGKFKKCLILDLDNTLWGGVIGDDGIEHIQIGDLGIGKAFSGIQMWAKQLKQRGIILAVCSKNNEAIAKEPFEKHPQMILHLDDIAIFMANWDNKADNIIQIQRILNIGFDSMVFLDDNPFERNMVRSTIPEITVPELPEDPAEYLSYLRTLNLFETASFTPEDDSRTLRYQQEALRADTKKKYANEREFLDSLNMLSAVESFTPFNTPRVAQLTQRSNQFNLRTIRYSEEEIQQLVTDTDCIPLSFSLEDRYGEYGLISSVILKKHSDTALFIDTWIMSCRVLKRSMEHFVLNTLVDQAVRSGYDTLLGEYIPTPKNSLVKDHYKDLGFRYDGRFWTLPLKSYQVKACYIQLKAN